MTNTAHCFRAPLAASRYTQRNSKSVGFISISAEIGEPLGYGMEILLDEITLQTYDKPGS